VKFPGILTDTKRVFWIMSRKDFFVGNVPIRIGIQPFLYVKPLVWFLKKLAPELDVSEAMPRELASLLVNEQLDCALIPLVTVLRHPELSVIPGITVSTFGSSRTSLIFSKVAPADIKTILVDQSSINSIALIRALFRIRWSMQPLEVLSSHPLSPDYPFFESDYDAFHIIGDQALKVTSKFPRVIDLGEQWEQWTHTPLVHTVWAVRQGLLGPPLDRLLLQVKLQGLGALEEIIRYGHKELGLVESVCTDILKKTSYDLTKTHMQGIERFHFYMEAVKICKPSLNMNFYHGDRILTHLIDKQDSL
jgi:predicted solute-binding protein